MADIRHNDAVEAFNDALQSSGAERETNFNKFKEITVNQDPRLVERFIKQVLDHQMDPDSGTRKFVVTYVDEVFKNTPKDILFQSILPQFGEDILTFFSTFTDARQAILSMNHALKKVLRFLAEQGIAASEKLVEQVMVCIERAKTSLNAENESVRTVATKFLESMVITLSEAPPGAPKKDDNDSDFVFELLPTDDSGALLSRMLLSTVTHDVVDALIKRLQVDITHTSASTLLQSLTTIGKNRPTFLNKVVELIAQCAGNAPPGVTTDSQKRSFQMAVKQNIQVLLKLQEAVPYASTLRDALADTGEDKKDKRGAKRPREEEEAPPAKRAKLMKEDNVPTEVAPTPMVVTSTARDEPAAIAAPSAADTALLTAVHAAVSAHGGNVQEVINALVSSGYSLEAVIEALKTASQASGVTLPSLPPVGAVLNAGAPALGGLAPLGQAAAAAATPAPTAAASRDPRRRDPRSAAKNAPAAPAAAVPAPAPTSIASLPALPDMPTHLTFGGLAPLTGLVAPAPAPVARPVLSWAQLRRAPTLSAEEQRNMYIDAFRRVLDAESGAQSGGASELRQSLLVHLLVQCGELELASNLEELMRNYIAEDFVSRFELASAWLYQVYIDEVNTAVETGNGTFDCPKYTSLLTTLLESVRTIQTGSNLSLFTDLLVAAPDIPPPVFEILSGLCESEESISVGLNAVFQLLRLRPTLQQTCLDILLGYATHETDFLRDAAVKFVQENLLSNAEYAQVVYQTAEARLFEIRDYVPQPTTVATTEGGEGASVDESAGAAVKPEPVVKDEATAMDGVTGTPWSESDVLSVVQLYIALAMSNHEMVKSAVNVFAQVSADARKALQAHLKPVIRAMGMNSPIVLEILNTFPQNAESFVLFMLQCLTEKDAQASPPVVLAVKRIYETRWQSVRLFIPVVNSLQKEEVKELLPKFLALDAASVKTVLTRLLNAKPTSAVPKPMTAVDLLVELHLIGADQVALKPVAAAIDVVFAEKAVVGQDQLAIVLQNLAERTTIPKLFMRTVIQAWTNFPKLNGFVVGMLSRLVSKQVWQDELLWGGFVKCCKLMMPSSFTVLLQVPRQQLEQLLAKEPTVHEPFKKYVEQLRTPVARPILQLLNIDEQAHKARLADKAQVPRR